MGSPQAKRKTKPRLLQTEERPQEETGLNGSGSRIERATDIAALGGAQPSKALRTR